MRRESRFQVVKVLNREGRTFTLPDRARTRRLLPVTWMQKSGYSFITGISTCVPWENGVQ